MTRDEYNVAIKGVIYLCKCAVISRIPNIDIVKKYNLKHLYEASTRHTLTAMVGFALQSCGLIDDQFKQAVAKAQRKNILLELEKDAVFKALDCAGIWHMALKGTIIRDWYPKLGMRESADCDILFDREYEEKVREIMIDLEYTVESYGGGHHDVYFKKPVTNMQMHVELFGVGFEDRLNNYYSNIGDKLIKGDGFERSFKPEDLYIYMLAHNHRDYTSGGTGLRSLFDTYVVLKHFDFDWRYIEEETEKLKIKEFEKKNRHLTLHLLGEGKLSDEDKERLDYMICSGTYGTIRNMVNNRVYSHGGGIIGKFKYLVSRLILPMEVVKHAFPLFYKSKILLPFLPLYRIYMGIIHNRSKLKEEFKNFVNLKGRHL